MAIERYWVPHPEMIYQPALLIGKGDKDNTFKDDAGEEFTHPAAKFGELSKVADSQLLGVENICTLEEVNQAAVLHTVRIRFSKGNVYTRVARILIAVNPFKALQIYGPQYLEKYSKGNDSMDLPPHVFGIGLDAVCGLRKDRKNQAVLISGESGAGKTESTKLVLSYVSGAIGGGSGDIQDKIMQTNPVLEAFGNAMTVRNNNSSRFGKWLQISTDASLNILGCSVTDYLLELTRVTSQGEKERNYHVFFQIMYSKDDPACAGLDIGEPKDYAYCCKSMAKAPGVDDQREFGDLKSSLLGLGYSETQMKEIFQTVIGILTMGNIDFTGTDEAALADEAPVKKAAGLLGLDTGALKQPLLTRQLKVGNDVTEAKRTMVQAKAARDGLVRLIYGRVFKWLIKGINEKLSPGAKAAGSFFGVLDIAGFESFEVNSLEQLFINLSNEHLQAHFNNHIFKMELDDYKNEGVSVLDLTYKDNLDILALIEGKGGVLAVLDEEVAGVKGSDKGFLTKLFKAHDKHARLVVPKIGGADGGKFGIRHFAGEVSYTTDGFLEKNVDKPPDEAPQLLQASSNSVLKDIGAVIDAEVKEAAAASKGKKQKTVGLTFRQSLQQLIAQLNLAEPHFVRCIKPNPEKVPEKVNSKLVMEQLTCSGVFEAVRIRQAGYATRIPFEEFIGRYRIVVNKKMQKEIFGKDKKPDAAKIFLDALPNALSPVGGVKDKEILMGKSKYFAKTRVMNSLEKSRDLALMGYAVDIERFYRGFKVRKMMKGCKATYAELTAWNKENNFYTAKGEEHTAFNKYKSADKIDEQLKKLDAILAKCEQLPMGVPRKKEVDKVKSRMGNEAKECRNLQAVANSLDPMEIEKALARAKDLELPLTGPLAGLAPRVQALKKQLPLVRAMEGALEKEDFDQLSAVLEAIKKEKLDKEPEIWLPELKGAELAGQVFNTMESVKAKKKMEDIEKARKEEVQKAVIGQEAKKQECAFVAEEPKPEPTKRKKTITGFSEEDQSRVLVGLIQAAKEFDVAALERGLSEATKQGIDDCETIQVAQECFEKLLTEAFLITKMEEKSKLIASKDCDPSTLKALQNLVNQAKALSVAADAINAVKQAQQDAVRRRARSTIHGACFDNVALDEMHLVEGEFSDLLDYGGLKDPTRWRGHKSATYFSKGERGQEIMLKHNKNELKEGLTKVLYAQEAQACQNFRTILGWMGDRPIPESQRLGYAQDIVEIAKTHQGLANETYVQMLKQLTNNPSERSRLLGWKLMLLLCQQVRPSTDLEEFIRTFLMRSLRTESHEAVVAVKQCIADLNVLVNPDKIAKANEEQGDDNPQKDLIPIQVLLIDHSTRKVHAPKSATLTELAQRVAGQLRVSNASDFSFFQLTEGLETHRLLPDTTVLSTLAQKWDKLKEVTGRASHLLFKRRFMRVDETLNPGDLVHATLTYRQALWDYLHYPVQEEAQHICEIAASILMTEYDHYKDQIGANKLSDPGILEQLIPDVSLKQDNNRKKWAQMLSTSFKNLESHCDLKENRILKMSRVMSLLQRLKLFGAYFWLGRQTMQVPAEKVSVPEAPPQMCKINTKAPDCEYWIAVDLFGVRFVSVDSAPGHGFQRGFLFNEEAVERVLCWGARQNIVQFVVSTVNPAAPTAGRVPMTIALISPAAVDIAYAVHVIHKTAA